MIPNRISSFFISFRIFDRCTNFFKVRLSEHHRFDKNMTTKQWRQPKEVKIPASYGHIAAKVWGHEHGERVLALHGWQDNAGTFDRLIPLLTSNLHIVAIDAPGHGLSSHKPPGTFYHFMEMVLDVKRVVDFLKWEKFSIIGHSMGGTIALMYCGVYPKSVRNIILLDVIKPASRSTEHLPSVTEMGIKSLLSVEKKMLDKAPVYSIEDARARLIAGMDNGITSESADILLKRGCIPSSDGKGVIFSRDIRVKATEELQKLSHDDLKAFMKRIDCNMIIILGNNSFISQSRTPEVIGDFINIYKENCKYFKVVNIEGNHFVHLNNPERVAPCINTFFSEHLDENSSKL